jgi:hypothetical protein
LVNKTLLAEKGTRRLQALGGAAFLTPAGHQRLVKEFKAHDFYRDDESSDYDARFYVDEAHVERVLSMFEVLDPTLFELDPSVDAGHELVEAGILSEDEERQLEYRYLKAYRQPLPAEGTGTSTRGPARRLFHLFEMVAPEPLFTKILGSSFIEELEREELATTNGGRQKGHSFAGSEIADNLFIFD